VFPLTKVTVGYDRHRYDDRLVVSNINSIPYLASSRRTVEGSLRDLASCFKNYQPSDRINSQQKGIKNID
jgi:hypothetical protein